MIFGDRTPIEILDHLPYCGKEYPIGTTVWCPDDLPANQWRKLVDLGDQGKVFSVVESHRVSSAHRAMAKLFSTTVN